MTKIALLTDHVNNPRKIAQALLDAGLEGLTIHVVEDMEWLPKPDTVFMGGGGSNLQPIFRAGYSRHTIMYL